MPENGKRRGTSRARQRVVAGQRFGKLQVIDPETRITYPGSPASYRAAQCQCDCGAVTVKAISRLINGGAKSCGCGLTEIRRNFGRSAAAAVGRSRYGEVPRAALPGVGKHELFGTWQAMRARCYKPQNRVFPDYGGRGIRVCPEWHDASAFIMWIEANLGPRPKGMTLDRIDNDGNYEPGNIRWATPAEQNANRRRQRVSRVALLETEVIRLRKQVKELEARLAA